MAPSSTPGRDTPSSSRGRSAASTTPSRVPDASKSTTVQAPTKSASSVASTGRSRDVQYHRCKGFGHIMCDCPSQRALIVKDNGEYTSASEIDEDYALVANNPAGDKSKTDDEQEEHLGAEISDKYTSLIVKHVLSAQMESAEQHQRHNLFQTKFIIKERSCRVIIDGGSCNNLASMEMVEKLGLTTNQHPCPYYIQWFNSCGKLKVTKIVRVHFSLGSYRDYADCDVVPMQVCSLLLGRPWQYDKDSTHHGRTNQYTLLHKGKRIVLLPMSPEAILKDEIERAERVNMEKEKSENHIVAKECFPSKKKDTKETSTRKNAIKLKWTVLLANKSDLNELEVNNFVYYALVCKDALFSLEDLPASLPPAVTNLLQEFADVFPAEIPPELPP